MEDLIKFSLLLIVRALIWLLEELTDLLFGWTFTRGTRRERLEASEQNRTAHVVDVLWKAHPIDIIPHRLCNFVVRHRSYEDPKEYILKKKNVTLFTVDKKYAIFCESDENVDVLDLEKHYFLFDGHYEVVKRLVLLPHASFNRLADELGDPKVHVTVINNSTRCGSTLIGQIFHRLPRTRAISEPWATSSLQEMQNRDEISPDQLRKLTQSCMRLHCKIEPNEDVERIVVKMFGPTACLNEMIKEMFPDFVMIFNTRHPKSTIESVMKVFATTKDSYFARSGLIWNFFIHHVGYPNTPKHQRYFRKLNKHIPQMSLEEIFVIYYASPVVAYLNNKHLYDLNVLYEDLAKNPGDEIEKMFKVMNVPLEFKDVGLKAMEKDSQKGHFGAIGTKIVLDDKMWRGIDEILAEFVDPKLRRDMTAEEFREMVKLES